jgi:hypothetical protein
MSERVQNLVDHRLGNGFRIAKLAMHPGLTHWERGFIGGLPHRRRLTLTQQKILDRLVAQYLEDKTP